MRPNEGQMSMPGFQNTDGRPETSLHFAACIANFSLQQDLDGQKGLLSRLEERYQNLESVHNGLIKAKQALQGSESTENAIDLALEEELAYEEQQIGLIYGRDSDSDSDDF